jgi:hypothetical protein
VRRNADDVVGSNAGGCGVQRQFRFTEQLNLRFWPEFFKQFGQSTQTLASYLGTGGQSGVCLAKTKSAFEINNIKKGM